jgi:lysophospholipase L1-like esterase
VLSRTAKAALLVGSLLGALLLAELVLRITRPQAVGLNRMPTLYERDATTGYRYRPNTSGRFTRLFEFDRIVSINGRGLHDDDRPLLEGQRVVAVVGDSFTAAMHVSIAEGWPHQLEQELRERVDPSLRVVNLGLDGTGTDVQLELLKKHVTDLEPEIVVLGFYANDRSDVQRQLVYREVHAGYVLQYQIEEDARRLRALAERLRAETVRWWLFERSFLFRFGVYLSGGDKNPFRTNIISPRAVGGRRHVREDPSLLRILQDTVTLAESEGFELVVAPVPPRARPHASLQVFRRQVPLPGLHVLDLVDGMRALAVAEGEGWRDLYWKRDPHFSPEGNRIFARALADALAGSLAAPGSREPSEPATSGDYEADSRSSKRNLRP